MLHRLDMDTSGVLLFGKRPDVVAAVHRQFRWEKVNGRKEEGQKGEGRGKRPDVVAALHRQFRWGEAMFGTHYFG